MSAPSRRIMGVTYAIRELYPLARELEEKGHKVLYLNIGDPARWGFTPPDHAKDALYRAVVEGYNYYSPSEGLLELREAIVEKEKSWNNVEIDPDHVFVTFGVTEAIWLVLVSLLDPGDEVLMPDPCYPIYPAYCKLLDAKPVYYRCSEKKAWEPDIEDLRSKVSSQTKAVVIINPNNPTGAVYSEETVREILDVASERNLVVISDEIYDAIVYEGEFKSTASLTDEVPVIGLNGLSKTFLITGWRIGYAYVKAPEKYEWIAKALKRAAYTRLGASTPIQKAAAEALRGPLDHLEDMKRKLRERRDLIYKLLRDSEYFDVVKPNGAFYILPKLLVRAWRDDKDFAEKLLLEKKVLVVHGSGLGEVSKWHIRLTFLPPPDVIEEALTRINEFVSTAAKT